MAKAIKKKKEYLTENQRIVLDEIREFDLSRFKPWTMERKIKEWQNKLNKKQ